jgi:hypothetical protein
MRLGWFRPVHCKSLPAQEVRAVLTASKLVQVKLHDVSVCRIKAQKWVDQSTPVTEEHLPIIQNQPTRPPNARITCG